MSNIAQTFKTKTMKTIMKLSVMNKAGKLIDYCDKNQVGYYVFEAVTNLVNEKDSKFLVISKVDENYVTIIIDGKKKTVMSIVDGIDNAITEMRLYAGMLVNEFVENGDKTIPYFFAKIDELELEDESETYFLAKLPKKEIKRIKKYFKEIG